MKVIGIEAVVSMHSDGKITPLSIKCPDGRMFDIDWIYKEERHNEKFFSAKVRYKCRVAGQDVMLYFNDFPEFHWFMEIY